MVELVPPLVTGKAVPEYERASVPEVVTGEPATEKILGADNPTLVTPVAGAACQVGNEPDPLDVSM